MWNGCIWFNAGSYWGRTKPYAQDRFYSSPDPIMFTKKLLRKQTATKQRTISNYKKLSNPAFKKLQIEFREKGKSYSQIKRAAIFYVLNRTSYSGTTLSGGMAIDLAQTGWKKRNRRFNDNGIEKVREFSVKNFTISKMSFRKSIEMSGNQRCNYYHPNCE